MRRSNDRVVETERILKALANKRRLLIVKFLQVRKAASVGEIASHIRLSFAATSRHLRTLANVDLVESAQISTTVNYSLPATQNTFLETVLRKI